MFRQQTNKNYIVITTNKKSWVVLKKKTETVDILKVCKTATRAVLQRYKEILFMEKK